MARGMLNQCSIPEYGDVEPPDCNQSSDWKITIVQELDWLLAELLKYGGEELHKAVYDLFLL